MKEFFATFEKIWAVVAEYFLAVFDLLKAKDAE